MNEISEEKLPSICRLCLNDKCDWLLRVTDELLPKVELADINIFETPQLPQKVCNICLKKLHGFYDFRMMCKQSENLLYEKFPHLINERKITPEFLQVLITESRLDTEPQEPELLLIKEEVYDCLEIKSDENPIITEEITKEDSQQVTDTSTPKINHPARNQAVTQEITKASHKVTDKSSPKTKPARKMKEKLSEKKKSKPKVKSSVKKKYLAKLYPCEFCGKIYKKAELELHLKAHNNIRPFKCPFEDCGKSFLRKKTFTMHQQVHFKRDVTCDICQKVYQTDRGLNDHKKLRHRDSNIPCSQCDMKFKINEDLRKHMMKHTGERKYSCEFCSKRFATAYNLKIHLRIHTGDKPFTCEPCGVSFAYNSLMKVHNEKCHPES